MNRPTFFAGCSALLAAPLFLLYVLLDLMLVSGILHGWEAGRPAPGPRRRPVEQRDKLYPRLAGSPILGNHQFGVQVPDPDVVAQIYDEVWGTPSHDLSRSVTFIPSSRP